MALLEIEYYACDAPDCNNKVDMEDSTAPGVWISGVTVTTKGIDHYADDVFACRLTHVKAAIDQMVKAAT